MLKPTEPENVDEIDIDMHDCATIANGTRFGETRAYERLSGRVKFDVDPAAAVQEAVADIALAPVDRDGLVCFEADFFILRPVDGPRGNGRVFFD